MWHNQPLLGNSTFGLFFFQEDGEPGVFLVKGEVMNVAH
jgi:hypothetical protein